MRWVWEGVVHVFDIIHSPTNREGPLGQVVSCEFDAMQTYPREQLATGAHIGDYTQSCMEAHGYDWNLTDKRCQVTTTVERNPYCYTPHNSLDRLLYLIEEGEFSKQLPTPRQCTSRAPNRRAIAAHRRRELFCIRPQAPGQ